MIKGTPELIAERREEIVNACEQLYQTMGFKEITLKEIGKHARPSITISRPGKKFSSLCLSGNMIAGMKNLRRSSKKTKG